MVNQGTVIFIFYKTITQITNDYWLELASYNLYVLIDDVLKQFLLTTL